MGDYTFTIVLDCDAATAIARARRAARRTGTVFEGDVSAGTLAGNDVHGHYQVVDDRVEVTLARKPEFAPWSAVEDGIRDFFTNDADAAEGDFEDHFDDEFGSRAADDARDDPKQAAADAIIKNHVLWASGAGLVPIPVADIAAVTAIQVRMLEELSSLYSAEYTRNILRSFVTAFTGGMAARVGASLLKAIPGLGSVLGGVSMSAMSGASTYAVGQVAKKQLRDGDGLHNFNTDELAKAYKDALEVGKAYVIKLQNQRKQAQKSAERPPASAGLSNAEELERLASLRDSGILTDDEFETEKQKVLARD